MAIGNLETQVASIRIGNQQLEVIVPNTEAVKTWYQSQVNSSFPYWAKLWPAAIGLSNYIIEKQQLFTAKTVVELGAGLGLPSAVVASFAKQVICTDVDANATAFMQLQPCLQKPTISFSTLDLFSWNGTWNQQPIQEIICADVNYSPAYFDAFLEKIGSWQQAGCTITLATPQRLLATYFAEQMHQLTPNYHTCWVENEPISIWRVS